MAEILFLGNLNLSILEKEFGNLQTSEIIITNERLAHIKERHLIDYELFETYGEQCVQNPDYIIKDCKNRNTVFMIKNYPIRT